jgi:hypothetical protein
MWLQIIKIFFLFFYFQFEDNSYEQNIDMNHRSLLIQEYLPKEIETILNTKKDSIGDEEFQLLQFIVLFIGWGILFYNLPTIVDSIYNYMNSSIIDIDHLQRNSTEPYNIKSIGRLAESIKLWDAFHQWVISNRLEKGYNKKGLLFLMLKKSTESIIYPEDFIVAMRGNLIF